MVHSSTRPRTREEANPRGTGADRKGATKEENLCVMHEEEAVAPLPGAEREGILLMQARSR
jgi:hypothetical protein